MEGRNKQTEYTNDSEQYQLILEDQNHCCLCGTKLAFKHQVDYLTLDVIEDADCPSCMIRLKTREHILQ